MCVICMHALCSSARVCEVEKHWRVSVLCVETAEVEGGRDYHAKRCILSVAILSKRVLPLPLPSLSSCNRLKEGQKRREKRGEEEGRGVKREEGRDVKSGSLVLLSLPPTVVYFSLFLSLFLCLRGREEKRGLRLLG